MKITKEYLRSHPNEIFVYGDNVIRQGHGGAAKLRDEPNTYGFITKIRPNNHPTSFFTKSEYKKVLDMEITKLEQFIFYRPFSFEIDRFLISPVGSGLANKHGIWELIEPRLKMLKKYDSSDKRIVLLWEDEI